MNLCTNLHSIYAIYVVVCIVDPMEACHLLLGRPWQFDRGVQHDGRSNKYSFMHFGKKLFLHH